MPSYQRARIVFGIGFSYLVVLVKSVKVANIDQAPYLIITQAYPVIEVPEPDDGIVVLD